MSGDGLPPRRVASHGSKTISPVNNVDNEEDDAEKEVDVEQAAEEEFGIRNPRKLLDPKLPTQKEIDEHCLTHLPFRNWCPHCVAGKGKMAPHYKQPDRADGLA